MRRLLLVLLATPAIAADEGCNTNALGIATVLSCPDWYQAEPSTRMKAIEWASGFLTARNLYGPGKGMQIPLKPSECSLTSTANT